MRGLPFQGRFQISFCEGIPGSKPDVIRAPGRAVAALLLSAAPAESLPQTSAAPQTEKQKIESPRFAVRQASSKIEIDGVLDEEAWKTAALIPPPFEWQPGDNIPAPVKTECLVTYDLHNLYVAFRCYDPEPGKIRAHFMDRDDTDKLILDDHISIMIDSFNKGRASF